jgi:hypothetical protein
MANMDKKIVSIKSSLFVSLLVLVLAFSLFTCVSLNGSSGASLENAVHVKNEAELKNAINNAPTGGSTTITLDNDITLTSYETSEQYTGYIYLYHNATLIFPANKDITLTSNRVNGFYKLIGAVDVPTTLVEGGGTLRLDGIIVTHKNGVTGCGVDVSGTLYLYNGEISGNTNDIGGGVNNRGTFAMSGGKIFNNTACWGGGVITSGSEFNMSGGEISGNTAIYEDKYSEAAYPPGCGGGVYVHENFFVMAGGTISGNSAENGGGGIYLNSWGFTMSGGNITENTATYGGGIYIETKQHDGTFFDSQGGVISDNVAANRGNNVYYNGDVDYFSLRNVLVICVIIIATLGIAIVALFIYFQKKNRLSREKTK